MWFSCINDPRKLSFHSRGLGSIPCVSCPNFFEEQYVILKIRYLVSDWFPIKSSYTKWYTYIKKWRINPTPCHASCNILNCFFVTHFQLLLIQMPLRCVFLSEHNKSSYLPPMFYALVLCIQYVIKPPQ